LPILISSAVVSVIALGTSTYALHIILRLEQAPVEALLKLVGQKANPVGMMQLLAIDGGFP